MFIGLTKVAWVETIRVYNDTVTIILFYQLVINHCKPNAMCRVYITIHLAYCVVLDQINYMLNDLKKVNPQLKVLASVGGAATHGVFEDIVASAKDIEAFANSVANFVKHNNLDGIDIDWEFPKKVHKEKFVELLQVSNGLCDYRTQPNTFLCTSMVVTFINRKL